MTDLIDPKVIGRHLRDARKRRGLRQSDVAEALGMQTNSYGNFERGTELPSLSKIVECSILLGIKPGMLLDDCAQELVSQDISDLAIEPAELSELMLLLSRCPNDLIHKLRVAISAVLNDPN